jgi:uncharacterized protein (TIGR03067 family)
LVIGDFSIMKTTHITLLLTLVALTISSARAADDPVIKKDMAQLQGEWSMVSGSADGQAMPDQMRKQMKRVFKGDELTVTMGDQVFLKAKITIDPLKKPKAMDYDMTEGVTKGKKQVGIYELDGDTFKSCFAKPGADRPTDFNPGEGRTVSVWKREKAATPKSN